MEGRVIGPNRPPLADARIATFEGEAITVRDRTGADGCFRAEGLVEGKPRTLQIAAGWHGFYRRRAVTVRPPVRDLTVRLEAIGGLCVRVVDEEGRRLREAEALVHGVTHPGRVDPPSLPEPDEGPRGILFLHHEGSFLRDPLRVRVSAPGYRSVEREGVELRPDGARHLTVRLEPVEPLPVPAMAEELMGRIDRLSPPSPVGLPFVRVAEPRRNSRPRERVGFLVAEEPGSFTVLHGLEERTYERGPEGAWFREVDLADELDAFLGAQAGSDDDHLTGPWRSYGWRLHGYRSPLVLLAWAARERELRQASLDLVRLASADRWVPGPPDESLVAEVDGALADWLLERVLQDMDDPEVPRREVRADLRGLLELFPRAGAAWRARGLLEILDGMVAEDEAHVCPDRPLDELPVGERVDELVHHLRDLDGPVPLRPGPCDVFAGPPDRPSPALRLARLGREAVPALLAILDDVRLTRCLERGHRRARVDDVLRYGEVALRILGRIAGEGFRGPDQARVWWASVQAARAARGTVSPDDEIRRD